MPIQTLFSKLHILSATHHIRLKSFFLCMKYNIFLKFIQCNQKTTMSAAAAFAHHILYVSKPSFFLINSTKIRTKNLFSSSPFIRRHKTTLAASCSSLVELGGVQISKQGTYFYNSFLFLFLGSIPFFRINTFVSCYVLT